MTKSDILLLETEQLRRAAEKVTEDRERLSIGTLGEKTLHAVLKHYYEPDASRHEQRIGRFVADIVKTDEIIEIQTRAFDRLRKKLPVFLSYSDVTVIYPVAATKWLVWLDPETGETTKRRRSPKIASPQDIFYELYKLRPLLEHPGLHFKVLMLELEEYRLLDGWNKSKKRGSTRFERIPLSVIGEFRLDSQEDYDRLVPDSLPPQFTSSDYARATGMSHKNAGTALLLLHSIGRLLRVGKKGNAFIYERKDLENP